MSVREHFTRFAPDDEACILPIESHGLVCLGMLDAYDIVIQDCQWLSKGFSDATFFKYEGIAECNSIDQLTSVFYGSSPSVLLVVVYEDYDQVMVHIKRILTEHNMTLVRLSGAKSLRDPLVSQLLGEWVASSPLARARWSEATEVGYPSLIRDKQKEAVKQYASHLFPAPDLIGLLMDLNVPKLGFRHVSELMSHRGAAYTAATGLPFPHPIPTQDTFTDTWKELVTPLDLRPPVSVPNPPASGRSWPLPSWARYVQSRPSLVDTIDWTRPLSFIVRGDAYPCAGGSWTQPSIGLLNHGARGRTPAYLWVIG